MDKAKIREAVKLFLEGIGEDPGREGLLETPERVVRMADELFPYRPRQTDGAGAADPLTGRGQGETGPAEILSRTFTAPSGDPVLEKDITFYSVCEHHLLPFFGRADIAYLPGERVAGLSKLARLVEYYARGLQMQERMTAQIADALMTWLAPAGVYVRLEAEHACMTMRGIKKPGTRTVTIAKRGEQAGLAELFTRGGMPW